MTNPRAMLNLYFVAGTQDCSHLAGEPEQNLPSVLEQALRGGITCFQLREKGNGALQDNLRTKQLAAAARDLCRQYGVPFFVKTILIWHSKQRPTACISARKTRRWPRSPLCAGAD